MKKFLSLSWSLSRSGSKKSKSQKKKSKYVSKNMGELPLPAIKPILEKPQSYIAYRPASYQPAYIPRVYSASPPPCPDSPSPSGEGPYSGNTVLAAGKRTPPYPLGFPQKYPRNKRLSTVRLVSDTGSPSTPSSMSITRTEHRYQTVDKPAATPPPEAKSLLSELLLRYNAESVTSYLAGLREGSGTFALLSLRAPAILGLAPSLSEYGLLWQARYRLEVQLPLHFDRFRKRFRWVEAPAIPITGGGGTNVDILTELVEVIGLSVFVLWTAWTEHGGKGDLRYAGEWIEKQIEELQHDLLEYMAALE